MPSSSATDAIEPRLGVVGWTAGAPGVTSASSRLRQFPHLLGDHRVRRRLLLAGVAGLQAQVVLVGGGAGRRARGRRGRRRSLHGTHSGARRASGPGSRTTSSRGDDLGAGGAGHRDRPAPAPVAQLLALEEVRDDAVALRHQAGVLADDAGRGGLLGGGAGEVDGLGAQAVGGAASRGRCAHRYRFSPTPSRRVRLPPAVSPTERTWGPHRRLHPRAWAHLCHPFCVMAEIGTLHRTGFVRFPPASLPAPKPHRSLTVASPKPVPTGVVRRHTRRIRTIRPCLGAL